MARKILKRRVFNSTGKVLGKFPSMDLETFDMEFIDSDEAQGSNSNSGKGEKNLVPDPIDDNPLEKQEKEGDKELSDYDLYGDDLDQKQSYNDSNDTSVGNSSGNKGSEDESPEFNDDTVFSDGNEDDSEEERGGDSGTGSGKGSEDGLNSNETSHNTEDGNDDMQNSNDDGPNDGSNAGSSDGMQDSSDGTNDNGTGNDGMQNSNNDGMQNSNNDGMQNSNNDGTGNAANNSQDESGEESNIGDGMESSDEIGAEDDTSGGSTSVSNSSEYSDNSDKFNKTGNNKVEADREVSFDDSWSPDMDNKSTLESVMNELKESYSQKTKRKAEEIEDSNSVEKDEDGIQNNSNTILRGTQSSDEQKILKDMVGNAVRDASKEKQERINNQKNQENQVQEDLEGDILKSLNVGSLTSLFNPGNLADWKLKLAKIVDKALGFDIITNPNLINKKLEDAPPGREDDIPEIRNVGILLDCSGSMGASQFIQVIKHLDTMLHARKMDKTVFHILDWGTSNIKEVANYYTKVKGKMLKKELLSHNDHGWGTYLCAGIMVASHKIKKPDLILIMTDAEIFDSAQGYNDVVSYFKKHRRKIIWVLTKGNYGSQVKNIKNFDPRAVSDDRIIKFK